MTVISHDKIFALGYFPRPKTVLIKTAESSAVVGMLIINRGAVDKQLPVFHLHGIAGQSHDSFNIIN